MLHAFYFILYAFALLSPPHHLLMASSCLHWSLHEEWRLHGWCWIWKHEGKKLKVFGLV